MSKWLNNKIRIHKHNEVEVPCVFCGYCPYGQLVEEFPLHTKSKYSCELFGHDCPVYYHAEGVVENEKRPQKNTKK